MSDQPTHKPPRTGPPQAEEKLGLRDAAAFIVAALIQVLPYVVIAVGLFVLLLLIARLLG